MAREAGVSISTVSNALNGVGVISPKTKAHVLAVAQQLNYIPNRSGQNLRAHETKAIGLFVQELTGTYYGVLADTMHWECHKRGYELYIFIISSAATITKKIFSGEVDGAVILYGSLTSAQRELIGNAGIPVVFLDREDAAQGVSSVVFDSFHEGEMAANYLISLGHTNLMHVAGLQNNYDSFQREQGMLHAMRKAGLHMPAHNRLEGLFSRNVAYRELKRFLASGHPLPDAIFAANDISAIGCIEALQEEGISVPGDVSVIGCDDIEICEMFTPSLTTIRTCFESQGELAVSHLLDLIGDNQQGVVHKMEGKLVIRNSCKEKTGQA